MAGKERFINVSEDDPLEALRVCSNIIITSLTISSFLVLLSPIDIFQEMVSKIITATKWNTL